MKILFSLIILSKINFSLFAQTFPSSCSASDSIRKVYLIDAERLALRKIYRQGLSFKDSITIPNSHSDTILNALITLHNATNIPQRDSVLSIFNIHSFNDPVLNLIIVRADSNLTWMKQLKIGAIHTGEASVDSLISNYALKLDKYYNFSNNTQWHHVVFKSDSNFNLLPLTKLFEGFAGVQYSHPEYSYGDGDNIEDSIYNDHVELIFSYGWGDCPVGCIFKRYWKFNVYLSDCSIEFVKSYGSSILSANTKSMIKEDLSIFPNPFSNTIFINDLKEPFDYSIENLLGQVIFDGKSNNGSIDDLDFLKPDFYILKIFSKEGIYSFKVLKK